MHIYVSRAPLGGRMYAYLRVPRDLVGRMYAYLRVPHDLGGQFVFICTCPANLGGWMYAVHKLSHGALV